MIELLTMIALMCGNVSLDKTSCTKRLVNCATTNWGQTKLDRDVKVCVLDELDNVTTKGTK